MVSAASGLAENSVVFTSVNPESVKREDGVGCVCTEDSVVCRELEVLPGSSGGFGVANSLEISCTCSVVVGDWVVVVVLVVVDCVVNWSTLLVASVWESTSARAPKMETVTEGE